MTLHRAIEAMTPTSARHSRLELRSDAYEAIGKMAKSFIAKTFSGKRSGNARIKILDLINSAGGEGVCPFTPKEIAEMVCSAYGDAGWMVNVVDDSGATLSLQGLLSGYNAKRGPVSTTDTIVMVPESPRVTHIDCPPGTPKLDFRSDAPRKTRSHQIAFEPRAGDTKPRSYTLLPIDSMDEWAGQISQEDEKELMAPFALPKPQSLPGELMAEGVSMISMPRILRPGEKAPEGIIVVDGPWRDRATLFYGDGKAMRDWRDTLEFSEEVE